MYKGKRPTPRSVGRKRYNVDTHKNPLKRECHWPTTLMGTNIKDCNFVLEFDEVVEVEISKNKFKFVLVRIPEGTKIYHATFSFGQIPWFESKQPMSPKGIVWFASTYDHTGPIQKTHILTYTVKTDLVMIFEYDLLQYGDDVRGFEYFSRRLPVYIEKLREKGRHIDGYIGCNECEIGIINESISKISKKPENIVELGMKFID